MCIQKIQFRDDTIARKASAELCAIDAKNCCLGSAVVVDVTRYTINAVVDVCQSFGGYIVGANDFDIACLKG
jgi:hypothetical protein